MDAIATPRTAAPAARAAAPPAPMADRVAAPPAPRADRVAPALQAAPTDPAAVAAAARSFEAVFIGQMLEPMFATVNTARGLFGGGAGEEAWKPMLVDAVAKQIASAGGFGLAAAVQREMLRMQEAKQG